MCQSDHVCLLPVIIAGNTLIVYCTHKLNITSADCQKSACITVNDTLWLIKGFDVNLPEHKFDWY